MRPAASPVKTFWAFAAIYLIWGSTYLAIQVAVKTLPPFLLAGTRFLIAGGLLYGWARWAGVARGTAPLEAGEFSAAGGRGWAAGAAVAEAKA